MDRVKNMLQRRGRAIFALALVLLVCGVISWLHFEQRLTRLSDRLDSEFAWAMCVAALLLAGVFGAVVVAGRSKAAPEADRGQAEQARRQAEETLRAHEERLRLALSATHQALFDIDLRTFRVVLSPEYYRMLGHDPAQFQDAFEDVRARRHPDDSERLDRMYSEYLSGERDSHREELRQCTKSGEWIWVLSVGKVVGWDENRRPTRVVGTNTDITERKQAEEALAAERNLLRTLIDAMPDLVFTKDTACRFALCNAAELEHLGLSRPEELAGKTVFDLYPRELAEIYHADDLQVLGGRPVLNREEPSLGPAGEDRWRLSIKVPLRNQTGEIIGLVGVSRDITERKRMQESQARSQKLEALGTLAGGIAHDFNNILLAITGNTRLAMADLPPDSPAQESLAEIAKGGARAADLVRRILTFTRHQELAREVMELAPVVEEAWKLARSTLPAMIELRMSVAAQVPAVAADSSQVHQILMNLVANSAHAIGAGVGLIEVSVDALSVGPDLARTSADLHEGRYARLSVSDNGCGMDQATRERIFDPFFTTKPVGQGTGLGLSAVHGIMRSHEGAVTVYSQPGKGTTFRLYFPAVVDGIAQPAAAPRPVSRGRGERVLYVDDEEALVLLTTRMLRRLGYEVTGYTNPAEALKAFRSHPHDVDVVVTDLSMPGMSGFDLARELLAARSDIPILMTSGYLRPEDQQTATQLGIGEMILKPNTVDELGEVLHRLFRSISAKNIASDS